MNDQEPTPIRPTPTERVQAAGRVLAMLGVQAIPVDLFALTCQVKAIVELVIARGLMTREELDEHIITTQAEIMESKIAEARAVASKRSIVS